MMSKSKLLLSIVCVQVLLISLTCPLKAQSTTSAAEELLTMLPDDVVGFIATSGCDDLKPAFEKTIIDRIWNDAGVKTFREAVKKELLTKAIRDMPQLNEEGVGLIEGIIHQVTARPFVIGVACKSTTQGQPLYGFAILDTGPRKEEMEASQAKLESFADEGDIIEIEVNSVKMHGPKDAGDVPGYWGWVGNYFVFAVNDGEGLTMKYLKNQVGRPTPSYLQNVPGSGDALVLHINCEKVFEIVRLIAGMEGAAGDEKLAAIEALIRELGISNIKSFTERVGFAGPDVVVNCLLEMPQSRTGLFANFKTINLSMFDMADPGAISATAFNCDIGGIYDTIMNVGRNVIGADFYEVEQGIAEVETQLNFKIRQGLLESLSGPMLLYAMPSGATVQSPQGGFVIIAELKDQKLWEESLAAISKLAAEKSEGMVQVSSQVQDGRTVHTWAVMPLAMAQIMPSWTILGDHVVIGSNAAMLTSAVHQINSGTKSIRSTDGFREVTAKLPGELLSFKYVDSKLQFIQLTTALQQFWPMATMAASNAGLKLPFVLPQLSNIAQDMGPSCQYSWFDVRGLRSYYRGAGIEPSIGAVAGVGIGAGVLMPALARAREVSMREQSVKHLSGIFKASLVYANDYNDQLPPNLNELIEKAAIDPRMLECPLKPKNFKGPSYIYIAGQNASMDPENIIAYENPEFCRDRLNVLYMDGYVGWTKRDDFLRDLKATYKRLGKEMPEIKFKGSQ
jgi:hypothetical protein